MSYSVDFRKKVLKIKEKNNWSIRETARYFEISATAVKSWMTRLKPLETRDKPFTKLDVDKLLEDVRNNPDLYQYERARKFNVSPSCIGYAFKVFGISNKKKFKSSKG